MARTTYVKAARQRYRTVPVIDPETGVQKITPVLVAGTLVPKTTKSGRAIVRRITREDKSQPLPNYHCTRCGAEIKVGEPYKWVQLRIGTSKTRKNFCKLHSPRQSDMTTSGNLQTLYMAIEAAEDALAEMEAPTLSDLAEVLTTAAEGVTEASDAYNESADNMESGFGHETSSSEDVREKARELEQFAEELESAASEVEGMEDPDDVTEVDIDLSDLEAGEPDEPVEDDFFHDDMDDEDRADAVEAFKDAQSEYQRAMSDWEDEKEQAEESRIEDMKEERRQEAINAVEEALGNSPM